MKHNNPKKERSLKNFPSDNVESSYSTYGDFPKTFSFYHPKHVPAGVRWARFRLEGDMRLIGFLIDKQDIEAFHLNPDVFYIVFLDLYHKIYISRK